MTAPDYEAPDTHRQAVGLDPEQSAASAAIRDEVAEVLRAGRRHDYAPVRVPTDAVGFPAVLGAALLLTAVGWALAWMIAG